jgi:UDP-N-acetyl-D-glucosamine dehydrogenase
MPSTLEHFRSGDLTLGVIGLGYVGLPLAIEAAGAGLRVVGLDVAADVVAGVNAGRSHIRDVPDGDVAEHVRSGRLIATTDPTLLSECDAISICVPTPLGKTGDPDVSHVLSATQVVAEVLRPGQLVVLESTTYPGTTREVLLPALQANGFTVGVDFFLCFSPERVDPGNAIWNTRNTPKVIGGVTEKCASVGSALYERIVDTVVRVGSTEAAELTKILENTFRAVNIGLVNEIAIIADRLGVDVWEVIEAADTKPFGFMKFTPGPGLGGHCIPIDPHYLAWKMRTLNYKTRFIDLAGEINGEMPRFVVSKVRDALNQSRKAVNGSRILVLGVAYKRDVDDVRQSPALDILKLLEADGAAISFHDPHVPSLRIDADDGAPRSRLESVELTDEALAEADCVVIVTDHSAFDYARIVEHATAVVDARNAAAQAGVTPGPTSDPSRWVFKV